MGLKDYLKWLGGFMTNQLPQALRGVAVGVSKVLREPIVAIAGGVYGMLFGIVGILSEARFSSGHLFQFLGLSRFQWGFVTLASFLLLTHGIYRDEKQ